MSIHLDEAVPMCHDGNGTSSLSIRLQPPSSFRPSRWPCLLFYIGISYRGAPCMHLLFKQIFIFPSEAPSPLDPPDRICSWGLPPPGAIRIRFVRPSGFVNFHVECSKNHVWGPLGARTITTFVKSVVCRNRWEL